MMSSSLGGRISSVRVYKTIHGASAAEQIAATGNTSRGVHQPCYHGDPGDQSLEDEMCGNFQSFHELSIVQELPPPIAVHSAPPSSHPYQSYPLHFPPSHPPQALPPTHMTQSVPEHCTWPPPSHPSSHVRGHDGKLLFALEDSLRFRVNTELEAFRAAVQQILREQFSHYQSNTDDIRGSVTYRDTMTCHVVPDNPTTTVPGGEEPPNSVVYQSPSDMESGYQAHMCSQDDSVCSNGGSGCTVDSGVALSPYQPSLDRQMDQCLIRLQTLASVITNTLRRSEYSSS